MGVRVKYEYIYTHILHRYLQHRYVICKYSSVYTVNMSICIECIYNQYYCVNILTSKPCKTVPNTK